MQTAGIFRKPMIVGELTIIEPDLIARVIANERATRTTSPSRQASRRWKKEDRLRLRGYGLLVDRQRRKMLRLEIRVKRILERKSSHVYCNVRSRD